MRRSSRIVFRSENPKKSNAKPSSFLESLEFVAVAFDADHTFDFIHVPYYLKTGKIQKMLESGAEKSRVEVCYGRKWYRASIRAYGGTLSEGKKIINL